MRRWLIIFIVFIAFVGSTLVAYVFSKDVYEADSVLIVSSQKNATSKEELTYAEYTLNVQLVNSYRVLCKTERVLAQVLQKGNLPLTLSALADKISVNAVNDTEIISITVEDQDPMMAAKIANVVAEVFVKEIPNIMQMDNVQIIDSASVPTAPMKPNRPMMVIIALILGVLLGLGVAILLDYFDTTVKTPEQLEKLLDAPVLGNVPLIEYKE